MRKRLDYEKAGYKESQFYKLYTVIVAKEPYTDQLYLQEIDLVFLYFRLL